MVSHLQAMEIITNIQDDNFGGVAELYFAPTYYFVSDNPPTFKQGRGWIQLQAILETINFEEQTVTDENGEYVNVAINGTVARIRPEVSKLLQAYRGQYMLVKTEDMNGYLRLAGTLEQDGGMVMTWRASTGDNLTDRNSYQVQFTGRQLQSPKFL